MFIRCGVMALVAAYLNFLSQMIANPPFCQHVSKVRHVRPLAHVFCLRVVHSTVTDSSLFDPV